MEALAQYERLWLRSLASQIWQKQLTMDSEGVEMGEWNERLPTDDWCVSLRCVDDSAWWCNAPRYIKLKQL